MANSKDEAYVKYKEEVFKQSMPYPYEMVYLSDTDKGTDEGSLSAPVTGKIVRFPNEGTNVLNFEGITEDYIIFVSSEGVYEPELEHLLLSESFGADVIYCDEDFSTDITADISDINIRITTLRTPYRKPDFSPDTIASFPYIETCFAVRTVYARSVPTLRKSEELSDNVRCLDFLMRALERTSRIAHVPRILFHRDLQSLMGKSDVALISDQEIYAALYCRYLSDDYRMLSEAALNRCNFNEMPPEKKDLPLVSIIIPSKDNPVLLRECIRNIRINSGAVSYEIIVVDNGSSDKNREYLEKYISELPGNRGTYIYEYGEFNFSHMCNIGAEAAKGDFLLFMNDDVDAIEEAFLEKMLVYAAREHVGAVGVKLLYPENGCIQHIGVFDTYRGPVHKLNTYSDSKVQYFCRNRFAWDVLAVTGACLMVDREKYFKVGGFNDKMKVGYNDVDLCAKLIENGFFNVVNNDCTLIHHESLSRGDDSGNDEKALRLRSERDYFYDLHPWLMLHRDPYYGYKLDEDTIAIKSIVVPDYQKADYRNRVKIIEKLPAVSDKVNMSVDYCGIERGIGRDCEDAYVIEGWCLDTKSDNALFEKYLVLLPLEENGDIGKEKIAATTCPKMRKDVCEVFPGTVNSMLAGFTCRIPFSQISDDKQYRIGVLLKKKTGFRKYRLTLGDYIYEPRRGIITDK